MLVPADGVKGVKKAVMDIILHASCNPCPPMVVGIGIGGTMDRAAVMSKKHYFVQLMFVMLILNMQNLKKSF